MTSSDHFGSGLTAVTWTWVRRCRLWLALLWPEPDLASLGLGFAVGSLVHPLGLLSSLGSWGAGLCSAELPASLCLWLSGLGFGGEPSYSLQLCKVSQEGSRRVLFALLNRG